MSPLEFPHDLNADTWHAGGNLWLYADFFFDSDLCPDPPPERKFRLLLAAALRAVWDHHIPESRIAVEEVERFADNPDPDRIQNAYDAMVTAHNQLCESADREGDQFMSAFLPTKVAWCATQPDPLNNTDGGPIHWVESITDLESDWIPNRSREAAEALHLSLFHDLFPNPFRPVAVDPAWRTSTVVGLCRTMYEARDFAAMPILADALQDAGCEDETILAHCRGDGPHARGCWIIDLFHDVTAH